MGSLLWKVYENKNSFLFVSNAKNFEVTFIFFLFFLLVVVSDRTDFLRMLYQDVCDQQRTELFHVMYFRDK